MTDINPSKLLGLKSIKEYQKIGMGKMIGDHLKLAWYFEKGYEKLILVIMVLLGFWKIVGFFI